MFSYSFRQLFRRCLTSRTSENRVNLLNICKFESNLIKTTRALCTATEAEDKHDQKNKRTSDKNQVQYISKIESIFNCDTKKATEVFNALKTPHTNPNLSDIVTKVKWLRRQNIQLSTILDNYRLLLKPLEEIQSVYIFLEKMVWERPDHILPCVKMSLEEVKKIKSSEVNRIRIRVYWLAAELKSDPYDVSKNCAKHPFILLFNDPLKLRRKIQILQEYGVSTEDIVRDFMNLGLSEEYLKRRLTFLKANGITNYLGWTLRGSEEAIQIMINRRNELDPDKLQMLDNLAKTLKLNGHTARMLVVNDKYKFIQKLGAHKISSVLQFLLEKFTADEIVKNIKMIAWDREELERRISEAKALGIECLEPIWLAKSKEEYQKWLKEIAKSKQI